MGSFQTLYGQQKKGILSQVGVEGTMGAKIAIKTLNRAAAPASVKLGNQMKTCSRYCCSRYCYNNSPGKHHVFAIGSSRRRLRRSFSSAALVVAIALRSKMGIIIRSFLSHSPQLAAPESMPANCRLELRHLPSLERNSVEYQGREAYKDFRRKILVGGMYS